MMYTKYISLLLAMILFLSMLFSCGTQTEEGIAVPSGMQAIASEAGDYYLMVPAAWLPDTTKGMTSAFAEDAARSSVTVCANELTREIDSIASYWDEFQAQFAAAFSDFTMLDELPTDVTIAAGSESAIEGKKYRYTATIGEVQYQWMQILFIRNATIYIFTYTSTVDGYEENLDTVNEILSNFTFR